MQWNYQCPRCGEWRVVDWVNRMDARKCHRTGQAYTPPSPAQQHNAFVDTHEWPAEMEEAVISAKGGVCTAPDCQTRYQTLDHHIPYAKGGRTSVENLNPMCNKHNQEKSDKNPSQWEAEHLIDQILKKIKRK